MPFGQDTFQLPKFAGYDTGKITGYAVPHCRDKEVSLTSLTDSKR